MPSYAGAIQAVKDYLDANFSAIPVAYMNDDAVSTADSDGLPTPWALIEIRGTGNEPMSVALKGDRLWMQHFMLWAHVYTPVGTGEDDARDYAEQIGNVFRDKEFYNGTVLHCVRTHTPSIDGGDSGSDDGKWFRVSMNIDGEYWHQA